MVVMETLKHRGSGGDCGRKIGSSGGGDGGRNRDGGCGGGNIGNGAGRQRWKHCRSLFMVQTHGGINLTRRRGRLRTRKFVVWRE